jgi:hypothetical protein
MKLADAFASRINAPEATSGSMSSFLQQADQKRATPKLNSDSYFRQRISVPNSQH